jgi:hypothetical protein
VGALIVATIGAVVFATVQMYKHWDEFKAYMSSSFMDAMRAVGGWFKELGTYLGGSFMDAVHGVGGWFHEFGSYMGGSFMDAVHGARDLLGSFWSDLEPAFASGINNIIGMLNTFLGGIEAIGNIVGNIPGLGFLGGHNSLIPMISQGVASSGVGSVGRSSLGTQRFHGGGLVPGAYGQEVLALLQGGERVIPKEHAGVGGGIGQVNVYNPTSNVDVVTAIDQQRWLARMSRRGIGAPASWPLTMAGA